MESIFILIILSLIIYIINVIPLFMPPTWSILAFYYITFHPPLLETVILGAISATLGRVTLYYLSKNHFRKLFTKTMIKNYDALGKFFDKKQKISIPLFLTYAFFPISSNFVYIAAGLAKINIKILATSFLVGRFLSYGFWITATHIATTRLEDIFSKRVSNVGLIIIELLGLFLIILIGRINWKKVLKLK